MRISAKHLIGSLLGLSLGLALPVFGHAQEAPTAVGEQTRSLLAKQRSGSSASAEAKPLLEDVAQRNYTRYLESFTHPIPKSYQEEREDFIASGGN